MTNTSAGFYLNRTHKRQAISNTVILALFVIIVIVVAGGAVLGYNFGFAQSNQSIVNSLQNQLKSEQSNISSIQAKSVDFASGEPEASGQEYQGRLGEHSEFRPGQVLPSDHHGKPRRYDRDHVRKQRQRRPYIYSGIAIRLPDQCHSSWNHRLPEE